MKVGERIQIKCLDTKRSYVHGNTSPYPEFDACWIPCKVIAEYPSFYVLEVQEHKNPKTFFNYPWVPYNITIDKFEIGKMFHVKH